MGRYRKSQYGNLAKYNDTYVNKEGTYIEDGGGNQLTIQTDSDGYKFTDESYYLTYIDEAVIRGFKKKPDLSSCDGYVVSHIDGDVSNCCIDNLEWVKIDPRYVEYDKIRKQRQKDMIKEYNPGRKLPDYWPQ